jgi:hypothetical protein
MDKEELKRLAADPRFIQGIYNYCDRWCERCPFTSRCLNFAMGDEQFTDPDSRDINNEAFWEKFSESLQVTLDLLKEAAEREGIDLNSVDLEEDAEERRLRKEVAENHVCCREAKVYADMVDDWFDSLDDLFGRREDGLNSGVGIALPRMEQEEKGDLEDALEVIRWYQHQIYVKLMRAVRGELEERQEILDEFPRDSDGSAKVALIGIDRSISAWGQIRNCLPMRTDDLEDLLVHLYRLRRKVEETFPNARSFIRPGFDKIDLNA